jgi:hypothetical protein
MRRRRAVTIQIIATIRIIASQGHFALGFVGAIDEDRGVVVTTSAELQAGANCGFLRSGMPSSCLSEKITV